MAIDGIKIIDSDSAFDIYNPIIRMYNDGETLEKIREEIQKDEIVYSFSELELEIYFTSFALTMWQIGGLTEELLEKVRKIVEKGATDLWDKIALNAKKDRQKELIKLLKKIEKPNNNIKKRKVTNDLRIEHIFHPQEVLTFKLEDNNYGATILITEDTENKVCYYYFAEIILRSDTKPTMESILQSKVHAGINLGFKDIRYISHKNLLKIKDSFEKVGKLDISANNRQLACYPGEKAETFEEFCYNWNWKGDKRNRKKLRNLVDLLDK